ncbi:hypothetical protein HID58_082090 [Brassica napus]|uniref:CASP-like protein n=1 Tax=Brassica napus TaxID=3708 RepID=A0ABQ7Y9L8_BRANA|nr:hypothetical protein HID58_082090 [Brassica napus]
MASSRSRTNPSLVCVSVQVCLTQITSFVSKEFGVVSFTDREVRGFTSGFLSFDLNAIMSFAAAFFLISVGFGGAFIEALFGRMKCVTAVSGSVCDPRVVLSYRREVFSLLVEVDVIVRWAVGDNDKSRSEFTSVWMYRNVAI